MMLDCFKASRDARSVPIIPLTRAELERWHADQDEARKNWISANNFSAKAHSRCLLPADDGQLDVVLLGVESMDDMWAFGYLPRTLPPVQYRIEADWPRAQLEQAALAWALGAYRFERYTKNGGKRAILDMGAAPLETVTSHAAATWKVRDLVNTAPEDMMPQHLRDEVRTLADVNDAEFHDIAGDALLEQNYPTIHAVGRASVHPPRLLDLRWGNSAHPAITLVGKGVCFDSGGLDIKNANGMRLMKKDMGGGAHALGLAQMVMDARLPVRLRLLIPAVENAVAGNAFHPGDVVTTRAGKSVEIENTDAEGRLVLCDALTEALNAKPDLIVDFATLTGAARVALGTELPAFFSNSESVADGLYQSAAATQDPLWRLPLHEPYREMLHSGVADLMNCTSGPYGGAITAALFLEEFVPKDVDWVHFDIMAWNIRSRPGRAKGGEAMGIRAVFDYLQRRFSS